MATWKQSRLFWLWFASSVAIYVWLVVAILDQPPRQSEYIIVAGIAFIPIAAFVIGRLIVRTLASKGLHRFRPVIAGTLIWVAAVLAFSVISSAAEGDDFDDYFFDNLWGPLLCFLPPAVTVLALSLIRWAYGEEFSQFLVDNRTKATNILVIALLMATTTSAGIAASKSIDAYDAASSAQWEAEDAASAAREAASMASSAEDTSRNAALEAELAAQACMYR
jgi:hypothetical protein